MPLAEGQVQLRDLVMGPGTPFTVHRFNPFTRSVRAGQSAERAWNHGSWSGAEWAEERVVPLWVLVGDTGGMASWMELDQQLAAAFAPVGAHAGDVEMRFALGGGEYVMCGRPRSVEPDTEHVGLGWSLTEAAFVCPDPLIYSAVEHSVSTGLPAFAGGLTAPFTAPVTVGGDLVGGAGVVANAGTAGTSAVIRIDGPVAQPRVVVQQPDGSRDELRVLFDLAVGQWLDIDTGAHTALLNGVTSRRAQVTGTFPRFLPGESTVRFFAAEHTDDAQATVTWRDAWW